MLHVTNHGNNVAADVDQTVDKRRLDASATFVPVVPLWLPTQPVPTLP